MDFAFDRVASGRTIKCLVVVDDATHESVAIVPEHTIGGEAWRQEYNDQRPKKSFGGLTPSQYAKQLATRPLAMPADSKPGGGVPIFRKLSF